MSTSRGVRAAATAVIALVALLSGCTSGGGSEAGGPTAAGPVDEAKAKAALTRARADLHTIVDPLAVTAGGAVRAPFPVCAGKAAPSPTSSASPSGPDPYALAAVPKVCSGYDAPSPCRFGGDGWPQRWGYNLNVQVGGRDPMAVGNAVIKQLQSAQWKATRRSSSASVLDVEAVKGGMTINLLVDDVPGVLSIEAFGSCISADGVAAQN